MAMRRSLDYDWFTKGAIQWQIQWFAESPMSNRVPDIHKACEAKLFYILPFFRLESITKFLDLPFSESRYLELF